MIEDVLAPAITGLDADAIPSAMTRMLQAVRNHGRQGVAACAISAIDVALWDLKARRLGVSIAQLLGPARERVPVYASGGFTSTPPDELAREISEYAARGYHRVKIKIGRDRERDPDRLRVLADAGAGMGLMIDANGAYTVKQALAIAELAAGVEYFEEPVSSDDLDGLARVREHAPMAIAAGEYGYDAAYYRRLLDVVDIVQADATRCLGITGFMQVDALCDAAGMPLSSHCAPAIHVHACAAARRLLHLEHFRDHVRLEGMLFDGAPSSSAASSRRAVPASASRCERPRRSGSRPSRETRADRTPRLPRGPRARRRCGTTSHRRTRRIAGSRGRRASCRRS